MEIITVTEKGKIQLLKLMEESNVSSKTHYLRVGVKGGGCSGLSYELGFDNLIDDSDNLIETKLATSYLTTSGKSFSRYISIWEHKLVHFIK